jgi:hypothetical protein
MMTKLSLLVDFSFAACQKLVTCAFYSFMCQKLKSISYVDLDNCHIIGLSQDDSSYPVTTNLIMDLPSTCDEALALDGFICSRLSRKCSQLTHLKIGKSVSKASFVLFRRLLYSVTSFHVVENYSLHDMDLFNTCFEWKCLSSFHVRRCEFITSVGVVAICNACPLLENVVLDGSGVHCRIGDAALVNGLARLKDLRQLTLFSLPHVTYVGLSEVVTNCLKLCDIKVSGCVCLSSSAIEVILSNKKVLNSCSFSH